jgi:hypothetical protein
MDPLAFAGMTATDKYPKYGPTIRPTAPPRAVGLFAFEQILERNLVHTLMVPKAELAYGLSNRMEAR